MLAFSISPYRKEASFFFYIVVNRHIPLPTVNPLCFQCHEDARKPLQREVFDGVTSCGTPSSFWAQWLSHPCYKHFSLSSYGISGVSWMTQGWCSPESHFLYLPSIPISLLCGTSMLVSQFPFWVSIFIKCCALLLGGKGEMQLHIWLWVNWTWEEQWPITDGPWKKWHDCSFIMMRTYCLYGVICGLTSWLSRLHLMQ